MTALLFSRSVPVARRQLLARRGRTIAGVVGIAVAFLLVLVLKAIFAGMEERLTAFIDATGADVIVAQEGVTTMHMTQSALPEELVAAVAGVSGVASVDGIVYKAAFVETGTDGKSGTVALVGGGPVPNLVAGRRPGPGEVVLDRALADRLGVQAGEGVRILGRLLRLSGEVSGTASITGSYAFVARGTMERVLGAPAVLSYLLVHARPGVGGDELATRINGQISGVTASTRDRFAASERRVVGDMTTDIVRGMILVGFVIGVAVAASSPTRRRSHSYVITASCARSASARAVRWLSGWCRSRRSSPPASSSDLV